jgi:hypothetical protein
MSLLLVRVSLTTDRQIGSMSSPRAGVNEIGDVSTSPWVAMGTGGMGLGTGDLISLRPAQGGR